jgi:hypothetical protein
MVTLVRHYVAATRVTTLAHLNQHQPKRVAMEYGMGEWHTVRRLIASISENNILISGTSIPLVRADMHAASNDWALLIDVNERFARLIAQALLSTLDRSST